MDNDPLVKIAETAMQGFSEASEPGAFMVDRFPIRKYGPTFPAPGNRVDSEQLGICLVGFPGQVFTL